MVVLDADEHCQDVGGGARKKGWVEVLDAEQRHLAEKGLPGETLLPVLHRRSTPRSRRVRWLWRE
jgi:hypothetical protein